MASHTIPALQIGFWRAFLCWIINGAVLVHQGVEYPFGDAKTAKWLFLRGILASISLGMGFYSLTIMNLADASVLIFTSPIFTYILAYFLFDEKVSRFDILMCSISFSGVIFVSRPSFLFKIHNELEPAYNPSPNGPLIALGASFFVAAAFLSLQKIGNTVPTAAVINVFMFCAALGTLTVSALSEVLVLPTTWNEVGYLLGTAVCGYTDQVLITGAGKGSKKAGSVFVVRYLDVVFVFLWDYFLLKERISPLSVVGAVLICLSVISITINSTRQDKIQTTFSKLPSNVKS